MGKKLGRPTPDSRKKVVVIVRDDDDDIWCI